MATHIPFTARQAQAGFSMVELLMAAFIMGVGLLGLAALQMISLKQVSNGRGRSTATYIAEGVLQRAQAEGQHYYLAKASSLTPVETALFTASAGAAIAETAYGGYNVDGVRVKDAAGADVTTLVTDVPDANKRSPVFTVTWARRAYADNAPSTTANAQEFLVNVRWAEENQTKALTLSRVIRY